MKATGLLNPKNAVESSGGNQFKEGNVRVDHSCFMVVPPPTDKDGNVYKRDGVESQPTLALVWKVTRLDEDDDPIMDEHESPLTEELKFGLGGKALAKAHPGNGSSADDDEPEDQGSDSNAEGNTIFVVDSSFKLNVNSAVVVLMNSLEKAGWPADMLDRVWAPDYIGSIFWMKTDSVKDEKGVERTMKDNKGNDRPVTYKVVGKIRKEGFKEKAKKAVKGKEDAGKADKGAKGGNEADALAIKVLTAIAEDRAGESMTRKTLSTMLIPKKLKDLKIDAKNHVPILSLVKDDNWLKKNASKFSAETTEEDGNITVTFAGGEEAEE